ncbi:DUF1549 and DUF1553 domain-containing protein [Isosphaeraceae bacterium EP7]
MPITSVAIWLTLLATGATPDGGQLEVDPPAFRFVGTDGLGQIVVTENDIDRTADATYESLDPVVVQVDDRGVARPLADGATSIVVRVGSRASRISVEVTESANGRPVAFESDVVPIFTRLGCNGGGCHGKLAGQNGFRLSLLGFDPAMDHETLVKEGRGRRVFQAAPGSSLVLAKATNALPHGGGRRLSVDSAEYRVIARWIAQGARSPEGRGKLATRIEARPHWRNLPAGGGQQLRVVAHYADGSQADVTQLAQFQSNAADLATVDERGHILAGRGVGEAAIMARFNGLVAVARATLARPPVEGEAAVADPPARNFIDPLVMGKLRSLGLAPSPDCTDAEFARRSSLDLCGVLPRPSDVAAFEADTRPDKRERWVDRQVERPEYADLFAMKWSAILKNKSPFGPRSQPATYAFHAWIRQAMAENMPYDRFVTAIVAARGDALVNPPVVWYRGVSTVESQADDTAQLFLGLRIQCARCHHHPFERWSQDDYYAFASIFARIDRKPGSDPFSPRLFVKPKGLATHPITKRDLPAKPLGSPAWADPSATRDPRQDLAEWMGRSDNPFFARALVNRYWKHFLGRGLVEPEDDMRATNPATNPELLDALADDFVAHGFDLKRLVRLIATSRAYDRSSMPIPQNEGDRQNFARFYPRRLPAEILLDAVNEAAGTREAFANVPGETRAVQLADAGADSYFLDVFGRPARESVCECERSPEANLAQTLHLLNSPEIQQKLTEGKGRAQILAADSRPDAEKLDELYRLCVSRPPSADERETCLAHLARRRSQERLVQGYEDLIWALINTKEFQFNR